MMTYQSDAVAVTPTPSQLDIEDFPEMIWFQWANASDKQEDQNNEQDTQLVPFCWGMNVS